LRRQARRSGEDLVPGERGTEEANMTGVPPSSHLIYPENLTLRNFAYFLAAPTLIYQLTYPRSERLRFRYIVW
jgi:hypothetical protein